MAFSPLQERLGLDQFVDGQMERSDPVTYFAERLDGFEVDGLVRVYGNHYYRKPRIVGDVTRNGPLTRTGVTLKSITFNTRSFAVSVVSNEKSGLPGLTKPLSSQKRNVTSALPGAPPNIRRTPVTRQGQGMSGSRRTAAISFAVNPS